MISQNGVFPTISVCPHTDEEVGNFGSLFWDSNGTKKKMRGKGDSWSVSNNVNDSADSQDKKSDKNTGEVLKKENMAQDLAGVGSIHKKL